MRLGLFPILGAALLALACQERSVEPLDEAARNVGVVTRVLSLPPRPVDVLFVVDDSRSMCEEQTALVTALGALVRGLAERGADLRVAVTTTDMADPLLGGGQLRTGPGAARCASALPVCAQTDPERPWLELEADAARDAIDRFEAQLACRLQVGAGGDGVEMGLGAVQAALERHPDFARPEALLAVVVLSDENDCSDGTRGGLWGPAYAEAMAVGDDRVCELWRNVEDSCPWRADAPGPWLEHEGRAQSAYDWCLEGDRRALAALADAIAPLCPEGGCRDALSPRRELYEFLAARKPALDGSGVPDVVFAALVHPDDGRRDAPDGEPPQVCGEGRAGYRYALFAGMLPAERRLVQPICEGAGAIEAALGALVDTLTQPLAHVCLEGTPQVCTADGPEAGESCPAEALCCPRGQVCSQGPAVLDAGSGAALRLCSGFALSAAVETGVEDAIVLRPLVDGLDYALELGSPDCAASGGAMAYPLELHLSEPLPAGARLIVEYPGRLALD